MTANFGCDSLRTCVKQDNWAQSALLQRLRVQIHLESETVLNGERARGTTHLRQHLKDCLLYADRGQSANRRDRFEPHPHSLQHAIIDDALPERRTAISADRRCHKPLTRAHFLKIAIASSSIASFAVAGRFAWTDLLSRSAASAIRSRNRTHRSSWNESTIWRELVLVRTDVLHLHPHLRPSSSSCAES